MKPKIPKNKWCVIKPYKKGFLGISAHGEIFGTDKSDVIKRLIELSFNAQQLNS